MMNTWQTTPPTDLETLFSALKEEFPELGTYWLNRLAKGYSPRQLAEEMAIDLRQEKRDRQRALEKSQEALLRLEKSVETLQAEWQKKLDFVENLADEQEEKIQALNRITAQQQTQLNALLGNEG